MKKEKHYTKLSTSNCVCVCGCVWNCRTVYDSADWGWLIAARWLDRNRKRNQKSNSNSGFGFQFSFKQPHNTVQQLSGQCLYKCPFMLMNCSLNFDASSIQNVPRCTAMPSPLSAGSNLTLGICYAALCCCCCCCCWAHELWAGRTVACIEAWNGMLIYWYASVRHQQQQQ